VSSTPDAVTIPELASVPEVVDSPEVADVPVDVAGDVAVVPADAPVAGVVDPDMTLPPSKTEGIPADEIPTVGQTMPLFGIGIVPVGLEGSGLTPADESSVAPNGIPVGAIGEPVALPSGEVALREGVGIVSTWANAALPLRMQAATIAKIIRFIDASSTRMASIERRRYERVATDSRR
jgi:hypothetical protein